MRLARPVATLLLLTVFAVLSGGGAQSQPKEPSGRGRLSQNGSRVDCYRCISALGTGCLVRERPSCKETRDSAIELDYSPFGADVCTSVPSTCTHGGSEGMPSAMMRHTQSEHITDIDPARSPL